MMNFLSASASAAVLIAVTLLLRQLLRDRVPFLILWGVACVRLLLPVALPSQLSIYQFFLPPPGEQTISAVLPVGAAPTALSPVSPLLVIWLVGALLMGAHLLLSALYFRKRYADAIPVTDARACALVRRQGLRRTIRLCLHPRAEAPMTFGILRPVILLPTDTDFTDDQTVQLILLHELAHVRRCDCLFKQALALVRCIHWFNPMVWLLCRAADADLELACDRAVVQGLSRTDRAVYARTLLRMTAVSTSTLYSAFGKPYKSHLEERIYTIMTMKSRTLTSVMLSALVIAGTTTAFATNAPEENAAELKTAISITASDGENAPNLEELLGQNYTMTENEDGSTTVTLADGSQFTFMKAQTADAASTDGSVIDVVKIDYEESDGNTVVAYCTTEALESQTK